jgi:type IV pilus assembly protein PilW
MIKIRYKLNNPSGMSLIELLVAIAIGSLLMVGLVSVFSNSSRSHRELEKASQLIENGRYAIDLLYNDIRHAGYYGHFYDLPDPTGVPDPCDTGAAGTPPVTTELYKGISIPIQSYQAANLTSRPDITATTCDDDGLFPTSAPFNTRAGSDILVIRRADTALFSGTSPDGTTTVVTGLTTDGEVYVQANMRKADIQIATANNVSVDPTNVNSKTADNVDQNDTSKNMQKYPTKASTVWADTRKYHVHVYFVAPCSIGSGTSPDGTCQSSDDTIPTLKRLELTDDGSGGTEMKIVPLVEGVEYLKLEYGIDTNPTTKNQLTWLTGDGMPDSYVAAPSFAQWPLVVSIRVSILTRTLKETQGYSDGKVYTLAGVTIPASGTFGDKFKRHVFSTDVRPMNMSGRREIPE